MKDDFDKIGKKMPYRVPENFFEDMEREIMQNCTQEQPKPAVRRFTGLKIAAAAAVLVLVSIPAYHFFTGRDSASGARIALTEDTLKAQTEGKAMYAQTKADMVLSAYEENIDEYCETLSDEELDAWAEYYENDIFLTME